jgi:CubicO group peptidase (beta-lactamase class C family)
MPQPRSRPSTWTASVAIGLGLVLTGCGATSGAGAISSSVSASPNTSSASANGPHQVAADLGQKIDVYFAADTAGHYGNRRAVIVTVDGRLVASRYLKSTPTSTFDIQTIGGTIVTILVGIALDEGKIHSLDQTLPDLLPSYRAAMNAPDKTITLRQLITQNTGLPADSQFYTEVWAKPQDWVRRILTDGASLPPGSGVQYSSAAAHLVSVILSQATGQSTLDYARAKLFSPLGISTTPAAQTPFLPSNFPTYQKAGFDWPTDPQGHSLGAGSIKMAALDLAKIGQLMLDKGKWHGKQLVSADWMTRMQSPLQNVGTESDGAPIGFGYNSVYDAKITGHYVFATLGSGGQIIEVVPDLGAVVTVLSQQSINPLEPPDPGTTPDGSDYDDFVSTVVEPAIH